jgi:hypothetical protein
MKPSLFSTGLAFAVLGAALVAWGFFGLIPHPLYIGGGIAAALTGIGIILRLRIAHSFGLLLSTGTSGFGGWSLYRAVEESQRMGMVKWGVVTAIGLYLLVQLARLRVHFRPAAAKPAAKK